MRNLFIFIVASMLALSVPARDVSKKNEFQNSAVSTLETVALKNLPPEAVQTLILIGQGGPFPYEKDGIVFGNYEGILPKQKRGYYHEFTVKTPRKRNRGARRIIVGGEPKALDEYYYTNDHYKTFRRIVK